MCFKETFRESHFYEFLLLSLGPRGYSDIRRGVRNDLHSVDESKGELDLSEIDIARISREFNCNRNGDVAGSINFSI